LVHVYRSTDSPRIWVRPKIGRNEELGVSSVISYAQNFEDVMLARVFGSRTDGFYVDVGAGDPVNLSVTKWFYDLGWSGINIEPNRSLFTKLAADRPRDVNLECGAGASRRQAQFMEMPIPELSSFDSQVQASAKEQKIVSTTRTVYVVPLTEILDQHADGRHIDFLKIDVEGWEREVLCGLDLEKYRPTVILVEATWPETRIESQLKWEDDLIAARYTFVYFDGINRFYLANEHLHLKEHFLLPPNIFDDIKPAALVRALKVSEPDREARLDIINRLDAALKASETDRQAHLGTINRLKEALKLSEADREARLDIINRLTDDIINRLMSVENATQEILSRTPESVLRKFTIKLGIVRQYPPMELTVPGSYYAETPPQNAPRIALVTPSLNHGGYLKQTVDSILGQEYPNLAYFVQDGGSQDGSVEILNSYNSQLAWCSEPDTGQANAINRAFEKIDGDIMAYINSDDMLLPGTLSYVARFFERNPKVDVVYGHRICIDGDGSDIGRWVLPQHDLEALKWADYIPQETMFWRRRVWDAVGPFDESFNYALDWDFILRVQAEGYRFRRLPRFLACFRVHDEQKTLTLKQVGKQECDILRKRSFGTVPTQLEIHNGLRRYMRRHVALHILSRLERRWSMYRRQLVRVKFPARTMIRNEDAKTPPCNANVAG
jgi:FkbM family methyltransferase